MEDEQLSDAEMIDAQIGVLSQKVVALAEFYKMLKEDVFKTLRPLSFRDQCAIAVAAEIYKAQSGNNNAIAGEVFDFADAMEAERAKRATK